MSPYMKAICCPCVIALTRGRALPPHTSPRPQRSLTCYARKDLTDADEHVLWDLPPDGQVGSVVNDFPNGLINGFLFHKVQPFAFQDSWNS